MEELTNENIRYRFRRIGLPTTLKDVPDVFVLQKDITIIGRAKSNVDFFIDSSKHKALISRIHARISKTQTECGKNVFKIYDVSLNGTYVNDVKITSEAFLKPGDIVIFGHVQGAGLENGNCYKQADSEFKFVFESFHNTCQKGSCLRNERMDLSTPTSSLLSENSPITKRMLSFKGSDNDHKMLQEYASSAVSSFTKQNESDDDMILDKYTKILPHCCTSNEKTKIIKSPEKKKRKFSYETCSSSKCIKPEGKIISWVQCDDCDQWYHIKCCGLSFRLVKVKNSKFHCGCS